jgi:hypothetical protein
MYYADPPAAPPPQFPPPPPGAPVPPHQGLAPVLVSFPGSAPQSRGTVAIRILLAIPHLIVLYALGVAAEVIALIGWFAALFTGQLPEFAAEFLTGYLRWQTRVYAYLALLTDEYPPFALTDGPYPIRIATLPGRLNRLAVLFRIILVIPAGLVATVLSYGAFTIVAFVTWLIVLITGRMPDALYQALAAALRYYTRVSGYMLLLTSAYPGGLFGDQPSAAPDNSAFPPEPGFPPPADPWTLVLSGAARRLVGWFLAIGVVLLVGLIVIVAVVASNSTTISKAIALSQLRAAASQVSQAEQTDNGTAQACGKNLPCVAKVDTSVGGSYRTFASQVAAIAMPSGAASADAATVVTDATKVADSYTQLGTAKTTSQYSSIVNSSGIRGDLTALSTDYNKLLNALSP